MPSADDAPGKPRRRKRYRGTHPRSFDEKYKEREPERWPDETAKVRARGQTPAGSHVPVLLAEVLGVLAPRPGQTMVDATLGHGGHARAIAERLRPGGRLIGLDRDASELERTAARLRAEGIDIVGRHSNFAGLPKALAAEGIALADGVLADLGASSMQIDDPGRGFSFKREGPLDMRMDRSRGPTAAEWLRDATEEGLAEALAASGEPDAPAVARAIAAAAAAGKLETTGDLARAVLEAKGLGPRVPLASASDLHPAARVFQAIRMAVNREEESLAALLRALPWVLGGGGRAAIICFHSVEDDMVNAAFAGGVARGLYRVAGGPIAPSAGEMRANPRARSARLRWAERGDGNW